MMANKKRRSFIALVLVLLFTFGIAGSALAETTTPTEPAATATTTTVTTPANTTTSSTLTTVPPVNQPPATNVTTPQPANIKDKLKNIRQQLNQIKQEQHKLQVQQKNLQKQSVQLQQKLKQKLMPNAEFKKLLKEEVYSAVKGKKNLAKSRQGVIMKIETATNGKVVLFIRRGDVSKVYNNYFSANLNPEKTLVYDRTQKVQKTLADIKVGDVVRVIPVRGASLMLVEKIGQRPVQTTPTTPAPTNPAPTNPTNPVPTTPAPSNPAPTTGTTDTSGTTNSTTTPTTPATTPVNPTP